MKPITAEWIEKAEEDWVVMLRSYRARKYPSYNAACFHAQQCAEKYLKGRLEEADIAFRKTHDLIELFSLILAVEPGWFGLQNELDYLNNFSVIYRYPGNSATKAEAKDAVSACRKVREVVRKTFRLPE
jgi:HEPN domain-containing protein